MANAEQVVLLDERGEALGSADKAEVHHRDTPLHLAFSAYVFDEDGRFLLTRRAGVKKTWPGVWTNSCCGHPAPGEPMAGAVRRRLRDELGLAASAVELVLPRFRYRAVMDNGVVENELCPVWRVTADGQPDPDPAEVDDWSWVDWEELVTGVSAGARQVSPWCREQLAELGRLDVDPRMWPSAPADQLPPAAVY
ncbi:isopentenyl-diphosphate Delta-isomerase [Amycolatopsis suaedae]|uniref:Isopentenyl-diphosphate Delta-isomerase n=1 Tax=Amycolatopsis suaedae TaxID=2510978 RepID=A0A4Q7IZG4_9PSEU|nr:isopentenyl-diphosphate Delta-isomerase [Amycolatopsis suaedae]RZQ59672.1 isopentenyl-diphosphate Delta-isomerase [Amycolatopsis suaedae]